MIIFLSDNMPPYLQVSGTQGTLKSPMRELRLRRMIDFRDLLLGFSGRRRCGNRFLGGRGFGTELGPWEPHHREDEDAWYHYAGSCRLLRSQASHVADVICIPRARCERCI